MGALVCNFHRRPCETYGLCPRLSERLSGWFSHCLCRSSSSRRQRYTRCMASRPQLPPATWGGTLPRRCTTRERTGSCGESRQREEDCKRLLKELHVKPGQVACRSVAGNLLQMLKLARLAGKTVGISRQRTEAHRPVRRTSWAIPDVSLAGRLPADIRCQ